MAVVSRVDVVREAVALVDVDFALLGLDGGDAALGRRFAFGSPALENAGPDRGLEGEAAFLVSSGVKRAEERVSAA
jgi:hypothetical protein